MTEWHNTDEAPEIGRKFIALYCDGSGSTMFFRADGCYLDPDGGEYEEINDGSYSCWAYLPDHYEFWCELREHDPFTLRATP